MKKRNTMFLIIIAVATLLVTVVQTSFAFSASTQLNNKSSNGEKSVQSVASLSTTYDKNICLTVNTSESIVSDSSNLNVKLLALNEDENLKCTYDIIYVWNSNPNQELEITNNSLQDKFYIRTATVEKELTISGKANIISKDTYSSEGTIAQEVTETNIDKFPLLTRKVSNNDMNFFILVNDAVITSKSVSTPTEVKWNFELKFYNVNKDQAHLNGKTFGGYITVDQNNVHCD